MVTVNNEPIVLSGMTNGHVVVPDVYGYVDATNHWVAKDPMHSSVHSYSIMVLKS